MLDCSWTMADVISFLQKINCQYKDNYLLKRCVLREVLHKTY